MASEEVDPREGAIATATATAIQVGESGGPEVDRRLREAALLAILEGTEAAIYATDLDGRILIVNRRWGELFGHAGPAVGRALEQVLGPDAVTMLRAAHDVVKATVAPRHSEEQLLAGGSPRHFEIVWLPLLDEAGSPFAICGILNDVSSRILAESQSHVATRELEAFSHSVSHDLRAPLRAINGFCAMLREDYADRLDPEGRRILAVITDRTRDMGDLIDHLLAFSRLATQALEPIPIDMAEVIRAVFRELGASGPERDVRLDTGNLPAARGDPSLLRKVLVHLLSNAIKFTAPVERPTIEVTGWIENEWSVYSVKDNGVGFDMRSADRLFEVFQRLHGKEFEGTGVGLAIVQRIVHRHGGRVWASGSPGRGATFCFTLPTSSEVVA